MVFYFTLLLEGREQQLIDYYGGVEHTKVANIRRAVWKRNKAGVFFYEQSNKYFGKLNKYTGT